MSCCGKKRAEATRDSQARRKAESAPAAGPVSRPASNSVPSFQYLGKTRVTVIGPRSGKHYHFDRPGAILTVDAVDSRALTAVTILRKVRA